MAIHRKLFLLLIIFFPTQLGLHVWPEWSYVLGRRIDYLSPTIYFTDVLIILTLIFWWSERLLKRRPVFHLPARKSVGIGIAAAIFIFINIYFAASPQIAVYKWIKIVEYFCLGWYIVSSRVKITDILLPISIAIAFSSLLAIWQFILQHSLGGVFWLFGERTLSLDTPGVARFTVCLPAEFSCRLLLRPYATFPHPNVLGGFIATTLPYLIYGLLHKKGNYRLFIIVIILALAGLLVTFSRSAWFVGLLTGGVAYYILWKKTFTDFFVNRVTRYLGPLLLICFFVITLVLFFPSVTDESVVIRQELQQASVSLWQRSPITGTGMGNFLVSLPGVYSIRAGNFLQPVHNIYLLWFAETGLMGVFGILLILLLFRQRLMQMFFHPGTLRSDYVVLLFPVVGMYLLGFVDHYPVTLQQGQLLFTLCLSLFLGRRT